MQTLITFSHLESDLSAWQPHSGSDINPVPPDALEVSLTPDGWLKFTNASSQAYGGGLIARTLPLPGLLGISLAYFGLDLNFLVAEDDLPYLARWECDMKIALAAPPNSTTNIANIVDGSTQLNLSEGGMWQIDNVSGAWTDIGYKPGPPTAGVSIPYSMRGFIDYPNQKYSVLSLNMGGQQPTPVPTAMQEVVLLSSNWTPCIAIQLQTEAFSETGLTVLYKDITAAMSDQPF